jgi:SAM-dependent methyltransferase
MAKGLQFGNNPELYDSMRPNFRDGLECEIVDRCVQKAQLVGGKVLEIGLGTGLGTEALLTRDMRVVGVEPDERMLAVARRRLGGNSALQLINNTFGGAVRSGELGQGYDGVVAFTSIHWVIKECGLPQTAAMIADLLRPRGYLVAIHTPIEVFTEKSAQFINDSHDFLPPQLLRDLPRAEAIPPKDFSPYLRRVSYETWTVEEESSIEEYIQALETYWEIQMLNMGTRKQLFADYCALSQAKYNGKVPVGRGVLMQIEEKRV